MLEWLGKNLGTIVILAPILIGVVSVIRSMIRDKKRGVSSCSCGCSACAMSESCRGAGKSAESK